MESQDRRAVQKVVALRKERAALKALIKRLQWSAVTERHGDLEAACPICGRPMSGRRHAKDCELRSALKRTGV